MSLDLLGSRMADQAWCCNIDARLIGERKEYACVELWYSPTGMNQQEPKPEIRSHLFRATVSCRCLSTAAGAAGRGSAEVVRGLL